MYVLIMRFYISMYLYLFIFYYFDFITHNYNFFVIVTSYHNKDSFLILWYISQWLYLTILTLYLNCDFIFIILN